jgi:predicted metal-dependent HD superfamily phosphohydrolase
METELVRKAREYAQDVLQKLPKHFTYHNLHHTANVAKAAEEIGRISGLNENDLEAVLIAAWLHDIGYGENCQDHEVIAVQTATALLKEWGATEEKIARVKSLIEVTRMPQQPNTLAEKVLCDADLAHLGEKNIVELSERLRPEMETFKNLKFNTEEEWIQFNLDFFTGHHYHTPYGQQVLEGKKRKNIKKFKKMLKPAPDKEYIKKMEKELEKLREKSGKKNIPARGIETMFRITSENHITLSGMADTKSNIMISINSIILSVILSILFRKLEEFPYLLIPTLMLVTTCLITIVFAILATRPNVSSGKFTPDDIKEKKTNLLFFGNFHGMELTNYDWGMREMMKDADYLYGSLIKDIYFNGLVLARKYKLLRLSYSCFMFGFVASIVVFTIVMLVYYYPVDLF